MSEIREFVRHGASKISPEVVAKVVKALPLLKVEFTQIDAPKFPHLVDQLELLADVVEDYAAGEIDYMPLVAVAEAVFALVYAHRQIDLLPDTLDHFGHADDSAVTRCVLIDHEKWFASYADDRGLCYETITSEP